MLNPYIFRWCLSSGRWVFGLFKRAWRPNGAGSMRIYIGSYRLARLEELGRGPRFSLEFWVHFRGTAEGPPGGSEIYDS